MVNLIANMPCKNESDKSYGFILLSFTAIWVTNYCDKLLQHQFSKQILCMGNHFSANYISSTKIGIYRVCKKCLSDLKI